MPLTEREKEDRQIRWLAYRLRVVPDQLERARKRVQHLEREAKRLGLE